MYTYIYMYTCISIYKYMYRYNIPMYRSDHRRLLSMDR